MTFEV